MVARACLFFTFAFIALACDAHAKTSLWPACDLSIADASGHALASAPLEVKGGMTYEKYRPGTGSDQILHTGSLGQLSASVEHFIEISTLTMILKRGSEELLVSLARVPTENNPQSYAKVSLPEGNWAKIECETQGFDW